MSDVCRMFLSCDPPTANHQRKRIVKLKLKSGRQFSKLADKPELLEAKHTLDALLIPHQIAAPIPSPIVLAVSFTWPWLSKHKARIRAMGRIPHTSRPDCSNAIKTLEDQLVKLRFIEDDKAVADLRVTKWWGDEPGIAIVIRSMTVADAAVVKGRTVTERRSSLFDFLESDALEVAGP